MSESKGVAERVPLKCPGCGKVRYEIDPWHQRDCVEKQTTLDGSPIGIKSLIIR